VDEQKFVKTVALVTGGTGGLGRAVSLRFLAAGAEVIVTYVIEAEAAELKIAAGADSSRLTALRVDVTDERAVDQLMERIMTDYGRLDVLVNAVGGYAAGKKLWDEEVRVLEEMLTLNLRSGFLLARAAARIMVRQQAGVIVNIASKAAVDYGPAMAAYAASKAAALAMLDSLAADLRGTGVRANSVLPSIIDTPANRKAMPDADFTAWPKPEDIARVVLFLASEDAKLIDGGAIPVYGSSA
jgi:NAD(P)-dependent dehydrogenase (short-subunit alcohol dehydrogenase family)